MQHRTLRTINIKCEDGKARKKITVNLHSRILFWLFLFFGIFFFCPLFAQQTLRPFPQHVKYWPGSIKPNHINQNQLDNAVMSFYMQWKKRFIKNSPGKNQSFVWFEGVGKKQCVSEGQGYGMIIVVLMAGYDPLAQQSYNKLYNYYKAHPTSKSKYLMAWAQYSGGKNLDNTSASDGDIDIAYSLLLADKQWGSKEAINYLAEGKAAINAIMQYEVNHKTWSVLLSDGVEAESKDFFDTRSSDFMPANFKAFYQATADDRWKPVINHNYSLFSMMQEKYSPDAGLLPDFIVNINKTAKPARPYFLESKYDGYYNYNACRVPWRIGTDYLLNGDDRAKKITDKINTWIRNTTKNDTYNLAAGYTLAGNDIKWNNFEALSFSAPFCVAAMIDSKNQQWLNDIWDYLIAFKLKDFDYYDNTIKLLDMIIISGNYWKPA